MGNILRYCKALRRYRKRFDELPEVYKTWVKTEEERDICIFVCEHALKRGKKDIRDDLILFYMNFINRYLKIYKEKYNQFFPANMLDAKTRATLLKEAVERGRPMTQEEVTRNKRME